MYNLTIDDDDCGQIYLADFVALNHESNGGTLDDASVATLRALGVGASYSDGGGASPLWTLTRIA